MEILAVIFSLCMLGIAIYSYRNLHKEPMLALLMVYAGGGGLAILGSFVMSWLR